MRESAQTASRLLTATDVLVARPARPEDAEQIALLSAPFVEQGLLVARPLAELAERSQGFVVACEGERMVGCAGVAPSGSSLLVYNLCIAVDWQGRGIGRHLVGIAQTIGRELGYGSLLALTQYSGEWFGKLGFSEVPASEIRDEWRALFRPGRRSSLYQLRFTSEPSETEALPCADSSRPRSDTVDNLRVETHA
ncbi:MULTISPECIES: GNAT family N-acetyltransferase [unclassified Streptomyces]|uniref:GNAT family N-acetyltransferase n=1 Tax=unclassified Streptomyces TaxID=2593676 RepID=UPI0006B1A7F1|nr:MULTISPECIES: GNAT family N-acetyltransferase [unclassified Streptomyces]THA41673.1 GNAT family N-acetyltransferase [Streptomyces sp. A1547]